MKLDSLFKKLGHTFINARVESVNTETNTVTLNTGETVAFDTLLITSGMGKPTSTRARSSDHWCSLYEIKDAEHLRGKLESAFSLSKSPEKVTINIAGGGLTGVELLGEILRQYKDDTRLKVNLIQKPGRLLENFPQVVSESIVEACKPYPVEFHFNTKVSKVEGQKLILENGERLDSGINILCTGSKPSDYLAKTSSMAMVSSGVPVNEYLQHKKFSNIFVAGDSAYLNHTVAKQASTAIDMGHHAASNIKRLQKGKRLRPFNYLEKPILLSFGDINTFFLYKNTSICSPTLSSLKEAIYQFYMAEFSKNLPLQLNLTGTWDRASQAFSSLLFPQLVDFNVLSLLRRTKLLQLF